MEREWSGPGRDLHEPGELGLSRRAEEPGEDSGAEPPGKKGSSLICGGSGGECWESRHCSRWSSGKPGALTFSQLSRVDTTKSSQHTHENKCLLESIYEYAFKIMNLIQKVGGDIYKLGTGVTHLTKPEIRKPSGEGKPGARKLECICKVKA